MHLNDTEAPVQRAILQYLTHLGIFHWRQNAGGYADTDKSGRRHVYKMSSVSGVSDILGILPGGRMLCIEVKSRTGKLRPSQRDFLERAGRAGALAFVARSVKDVETALRAEGVIH